MKPVDGIYRTMCPTFPRSGHRVVVQVLRGYFGDRFHYTEIYVKPDQGLDKNPNCNFQKEHDFDLKVPVRGSRLHLVQIRNPFDAIPGLAAMKVRAKSIPPDWNKWYRDQAVYWSGFVSKWVYRPVPNRMVLPYERMLEDPFDVFINVIKFITKSDTVDRGKLTHVLAQVEIKPQGNKRPPYQMA